MLLLNSAVIPILDLPSESDLQQLCTSKCYFVFQFKLKFQITSFQFLKKNVFMFTQKILFGAQEKILHVNM